jgi:hypothetical protein
MKFAYAFFAEQADITAEGRLDVRGLDVTSLQFQGPPPWIQPSLVFVMSVHFEEPECGKEYRVQADLFDEKGGMHGPQLRGDFRVPHWSGKRLSRMSFVFNMASVCFPRSGKYHMLAQVEGKPATNTVSEKAWIYVDQSENQ